MDLIRLIQGSLSDDLLKPGCRGTSRGPLAGHCYVASEAYYHLRGGKAAGLKPMRVKHAGVTHWWIDDNGRIVDITAGQFVSPPPYERGIGAGFLTKKPSRRAREVIRRVKNNKNH